MGELAAQSLWSKDLWEAVPRALGPAEERPRTRSVAAQLLIGRSIASSRRTGLPFTLVGVRQGIGVTVTLLVNYIRTVAPPES